MPDTNSLPHAIKGYSGLIEKARIALAIQPYGTDEEQAVWIGVEVETVRRARIERDRPPSTMFLTSFERAEQYLRRRPDATYRDVVLAASVGFETVRKVMAKLIAEGVCSRANNRAAHAVLDYPGASLAELAEIAGCAMNTIRNVKRKLRDEGKIS